MKQLLHFEHKRQPVASATRFTSRIANSLFWVTAIVAGSLAIGMAGYMYFEGMSAVDAFANAAMILSGMGPLQPLFTNGGKIFAGLYALFSGLMIFVLAGLLLAPVYHRFLHRFHVEEEESDSKRKR